jgi:hypothetical protein
MEKLDVVADDGNSAKRREERDGCELCVCLCDECLVMRRRRRDW